MEAAGVRVHRQLVIRTLGLQAEMIASILDNLAEIITEYTISERHGLYGWAGRHEVVVTTLTKHKFADQEESYNLFERVINNLNPTYDVEVRTIRDMCDLRAGIGKSTDRRRHNLLFRKMISVAPGERVPRHRLIWNLIELSEFEEADREIRIFEKELRMDSPLLRYKIRLSLRRAEHTRGIMPEARAAIVTGAATLAEEDIGLFLNDKNMYRTFLEVGVAYFRLKGSWAIFDVAMAKANEAEKTLLDPDLRRIITTFEGLAQRIQRGAA